MTGNRFFSAAVTDVDTEEKVPYGDRRLVTASESSSGAQEEWVYVYNDEAATAFAIGDVIVRDPSDTSELNWGGLIAGSGTVFDRTFILGVAQHAIAAGSSGWILRHGPGLVKNGTGNISADTPLTTGGDRAGAAINFSDGATTREAVFGHSMEAESTDNTTFDAYINLP